MLLEHLLRLGEVVLLRLRLERQLDLDRELSAVPHLVERAHRLQEHRRIFLVPRAIADATGDEDDRVYVELTGAEVLQDELPNPFEGWRWDTDG